MAAVYREIEDVLGQLARGEITEDEYRDILYKKVKYEYKDAFAERRKKSEELTEKRSALATVGAAFMFSALLFITIISALVEH